MSTGELANFRISNLKYWLSRAKALEKDEAALHLSLPDHAQRILKPKRLLLWREMMEFYGYHDCDVFNEVVSGIDLVGVAPSVANFEPSFKPAVITVDELANSASSARKALLNSTRSCGDPNIDSEVYSKTMQEVSEGWLHGPVDPSTLGPKDVVSRRFGIVQSHGNSKKVRLIDDFSASCVNRTVQSDSVAKLHTLDVVSALALELLKVSRGERWLGKTFDLSSAYRQLAIASSSLWVSYIAVYNPKTGAAEVFSMRALPFGASRSVYGFLRVSQSLWFLGCKMLAIPWTSFFDDFVTFSRETESVILEGCIIQLFRLLGWKIADGEKSLPFSASFKALGVEISCEHWLKGTVYMKNAEQRSQELISSLEAVLAAGFMSQSQALQLRGRMQFAKAQMWGRSAKLCLSAVTDHAYSSKSSFLSAQRVACLRAFRDSLRMSMPRSISKSWNEPLFVFSDASFQPADSHWPCGLGGVLVSSNSQMLSAFSGSLSMRQLELLGYPKKKTVIFEAEMLAVVAALHLWKPFLEGKPVVFYIDNNTARDVMISASAKTDSAKELLRILLRAEDDACILSWFVRVPSESNISDGPSRNDVSNLKCALVPNSTLVRTIDSILAPFHSVKEG